ncbi:hypothetical protein Vretimale_4633 [Volvox reticuliferus]|uniref:Uncharacterized protein n=1 Tax=Volvox reticuliferus TaxID=1737510 RepID=A0A8J4C4B9_9CHLO|nr:hypothetical protein Vretifemale_3244 [Volvox reticuliferus]GIL99483.1 hypothetical protein Vretimale_4633 [Volvox reticuliferus]
MEKLVPRLSGGGAKLCTLDMQSYLEVMGRQLDEIQAQHHKFYASRQDRLGKLRKLEHPEQLVKRWSSESHGRSQQPGGLPPECQSRVGGLYYHGDSGQEGSLEDGSGTFRSSRASHGVARRSLHFVDDPPAGSQANVFPASVQSLPGEGAAVSKAHASARPYEQPQMSAELYVIEQAQIRAAAVDESSENPSESESMTITQSITPSQASSRPQPDTPVTPSSNLGWSRGASRIVASQPGTASSARSSPSGPYAVYDACGVVSVAYTTPDSHDGDCPLTASASSSSQGTWQDSCTAGVRPSPMSGRSVLLGAAPSSSTGSGYLPPSAGHAPGVVLGNEEVGAEDISPYAFTLLGGPFDGIDSEEDDGAPPAGAVNTSADGAVHTQQLCGALTGSIQCMLKPGDGSKPQAEPQVHATSAGSGSRPQFCTEGRAPLVVASLETEEALRALLATPRFARGRSNTAASLDVDGLEVPDNVLAALAKADGMDLDVALGAAMAVGLREQAAHEQPCSPLARLAQQAQGYVSFAQTGTGHMVMDKGAPSASPVAVPVEAGGINLSIRSAGGASVRVGAVAGTMASAVLPTRDAAHPQLPTACSIEPVNASIEIDRLDELGQTVEVSVDATGLFATGLRDSFVCAALMAGQVAPAQQPVLYSLLPKSSVPIDKSNRRNTLDGEARHCPVVTRDGGSRRNTVDGGNRRITPDECAVLSGYQDTGPLPGSKHPNAQCYSAVHPSGPVGLVKVSNAAWTERRQASVSPSADTAAHERDLAFSQAAARVSEGSVAIAAPFRAFRGCANLASPASSVNRQAGDGDLVLYGSPNRKIDVGTSASVVASPYTPPSPPPGPNTSPFSSSPAVPHVASRMQRSSRTLDEAADADADRVQASIDNGVGSSDVTAAGLRPWLAVSGAENSSKRQLAQMGTPGMFGGANNVHLDLSLTQAAAAAATCGSRPGVAGAQQPLTVGMLSPAMSQWQLRAQGPQQLRALQKHQPGQLQVPQLVEPPQLATRSNSSGAGLPSPPDSPPEVVLHDLNVDDTSRPVPFLTAASNATAAPSLGDELPVRSSRAKLQSLVPPLAAFSRAAALAAAADIGMAAPPRVVEGHVAPPSDMCQGLQATLVDTARVRPNSGVFAHESGVGWLTAPTVADAFEEAIMADGAQLHDMAKRAGAISGQEDTVADGKHAHPEHPELAQGQSPGHLYSASSAAKLWQLKARRQQQWQSQHGLQPSQPSSVAAATPQIQPRSGPYEEELSADAKYDNRSTMAAVSAAPCGHINSSRGLLGGAVTRPEPVNATTGTVVSDVAASLPPAAAVSSPRLSDAVSKAVNYAVCSKNTMVSEELNLGHGISGLSFAVEAGQVKWAWQTDAKSQHGPGNSESTGKAQPSPGGNSYGGSPCASPIAARAAVRDSGTDWALQQLPPPQWQRRRSEYSFADRQTVSTGPGTRQNTYVVADGGSLAQEQAQLRVPSATEGGGQPDSKAMALLRLKRQSIMRHNVQVSSCREPGGQLEPPEHQTDKFIQAAQRQQPCSAGYFGQLQHHQQPLQVSAAHAVHAKQGENQASKTGPSELQNREVGSGDGATQLAQPKPFLRRRSAKVPARKVDWSYVKPRTNSRNPDYYGDQNSPDVVIKPRVSPLTSPRGGVAKPPLSMNVGARGKKPSVKLPLAPTQEERTPSGGPVRRRLSNIPPAPGLIPHVGATAEERMVTGMGPRRAVGGPLSPLDDLLAHVNTLLRDFDKIGL